MKSRCPINDDVAYLVSRALCAESAIFGSGRRGFGALVQHPPGIFVRSIEEPAQSLVLCRIKLPQIEVPLLAAENPAVEHDLDHIDKLKLLVHQGLETGLKSDQLLRTIPKQALLFLGGELHGCTRSVLGGRCPFRVTRLGDVEPPRLPPFDGFHKGTLKPGDVGHFALHGAPALRLAALYNLRLDIEGL